MLLIAARAVIAPFEVEIAIIIRIATLNDILPLIEEEHAIDHVIVTVPRDRFVVQRHGLRRENQAQPAPPQAQTQVHVLVSREEMFIESAELAEEWPADHQARAGESGNFACADEAAGV